MIERLLAAEAELEAGELDGAERMYDQIAAADPHNAIALVGLARVAHRRGRDAAARELAERALAIDPEEAAATRLVAELGGVATEAGPAGTVQPDAPAATEPVPSDAPLIPTPPLRPSRLGRLRAWLGRLRA